jgi:hypothetical protein
MRRLLIGLSLAVTALATPALASECDYFAPSDFSDVAAFNFGDIAVPAQAPDPTLQYAVVRYYLAPQDVSFRPAFVANETMSYDFDSRAIPAGQFRIKAFHDTAHEHIALYRRFGELNYYST